MGKILVDYPKKGWSHLVADSIETLHSFAKVIGLKIIWFQDKRYPHYDVKGRMIAKAIHAGAAQVDSRTLVKFLQENYPKI